MCIICSRLLVALCWGELRRCLLSSDGEFEFILFLCSSCSLSLCWLAHAPPSTDGVSKCTSSMGSGMLGFRSRSWSTFELIIPLFEKLLLIPSCSAILNRTQRPSVTFPVLNPFLATSLHNHFSSKALLRTLGFYLVIIIINIIVIGAYPHGYNYIIIYHVSCYFKR
jgi:hypothetical protein